MTLTMARVSAALRCVMSDCISQCYKEALSSVDVSSLAFVAAPIAPSITVVIGLAKDKESRSNFNHAPTRLPSAH